MEIINKLIKKKEIIINQDNNIINNDISLDSISNEEGDSNCIGEDIIFLHNYFDVRKMEIPDLNSIQPFNLLTIDEFSQETIIDANKMEDIKIDIYLQILCPKIAKYMTFSDIHFNCTFLRNLYSYAEELGFEHTEGYLFPLIRLLTQVTSKKKVKNEIIYAFLENMDKLCDFLLKNKEKGYNKIMNDIVPVIKFVFETITEEIMLKLAAKNYIYLVKIANDEDKCSILIPILISLAETENLSFKLISIEIYNSIANNVSPIIIESYIIPFINSFVEDSKEIIRRKIVNNLINICKNISDECFNYKILPIYEKLCEDKQLNIRIDCCNVLSDLLNLSKNENIRNELINCYVQFSTDPNNKIKLLSLGLFGKIVFYLEKSDFEKKDFLLKYFLLEANKLFLDNNPENNKCKINIAFNFPSLVQNICEKISIEKWNDLKPLYLKLCNDSDFRIKKKISSSFAEIAKIIGEENTIKNLCEIVKNLFEKNGMEIKQSIINNLPEFLKVINNDEKTKILFLPYFKNDLIINDKKKWRDKIKYLKNVGKLVDIYSEEILFKEIVPIVLNLCFNNINKVRVKACKKISILFYSIFQKNKFENDIKNIIKSFAYCRHYHYRQLFLYILIRFFQNENIFMENFFNLFYDLTFDKIDVVRILISTFLYNILFKKKNKDSYNWILKNEKMREIIYRLKNDKCFEIKNNLKEFNIEEEYKNENTIESYNINLKFTYEMDIINKQFNIQINSLGNKNWIKPELINKEAQNSIIFKEMK